MYKTLNDKEYKRLTDEYDKVKHTCKCGHRVIIPYQKDKTLCNWCKIMYLKIKKQSLNID